jgi:ubiquinone/menaquinone biosynthesis C-methylase UbiE
MMHSLTGTGAPDATRAIPESSAQVSPATGETMLRPVHGAVVNHFDSPDVAERYAGSRPRRHGRILGLMQQHLAGELPLAKALDVGCGPGHSTVALLPLAGSVVGLDASSFMLAQADRHPQIQYRKGYAEALPFRDGEFDLLTVCSAYHWFDQERFLTEAARVLRRGGHLVLYKVGSTGRIANCPDFEEWRREVFRMRYPKAARNDEVLTQEKAVRFGFHDVARECTTHVLRQNLGDYVDNLLTHSSLIRGIDVHDEPVLVARAWLCEELRPFFPNGEAEFAHEDWIHLLRREEQV